MLRAGKVVNRRALVKAEEGGPNEVPGRGRFHVTPDESRGRTPNADAWVVSLFGLALVRVGYEAPF